MCSGILDHVERFSGHAPGKVERFIRWNAQRIFSPANSVCADAADGTSAFFQCSAALTEIPEKTRRRHAGMLECRLHTNVFSCVVRDGCLAVSRSLINYNCRFLSPEDQA